MKNFNPRSHCRERLAVPHFPQCFPAFQSTFPLQGTTALIRTHRGGRRISIHVPIAGNDVRLRDMRQEGEISIHVPIAGNDMIRSQGCQMEHDFNPRSHCRERRWRLLAIFFQRIISIHVPIAGNDGRDRMAANASEAFQSTFPLQGTTM